MSAIPLPAAPPAPPPHDPVGLGDLYAVPSRFWFTVLAWVSASTANYGVYLWGPTIIVLLLSITTGEAARWFVLVGAFGLTGKLVFAFLPSLIGRRATGQLGGYGIAVTLGAAAYFHADIYDGIPVFIICVPRGRCSSTAASPTSRPIRSRSIRCASPGAASGWRKPRTASARCWGRSASGSSPAPTIS